MYKLGVPQHSGNDSAAESGQPPRSCGHDMATRALYASDPDLYTVKPQIPAVIANMQLREISNKKKRIDHRIGIDVTFSEPVSP